MYCPNCNTTFTLRADYADHVQRCRPSEVNVTDALLARLNAAAARLHEEFDAAEPNRVTPRLDSAA